MTALGRDAADADRRAAAALSLARRSHARFVSVARLAALGGLTLYAFSALARVYAALARVPAAL